MGKTAALRVILVVILCATLRFVVLRLDNIDCSGLFKPIFSVCYMGFFVLPVLISASVVTALIPYIQLSDKRDRIAGVSTILMIPAVVNALLRILDFGLFECTGDGYYTNESICVSLYVQFFVLALPTLAATIFVLVKGWKLLLVSHNY